MKPITLGLLAIGIYFAAKKLGKNADTPQPPISQTVLNSSGQPISVVTPAGSTKPIAGMGARCI